MKVAYLTWGETPRVSGVFGSQAIAQFVENGRALPDAQLYFISAIPLLNSGLVREKMGYFRERKKVIDRLEGIPFISIPIYAPQNFIFSSKKTFPWVHLGASRHLAKVLRKIVPDVVHCRSYHAAHAALRVRARLKLKFKVVFDARGLWSEEVALRKNFSRESEDYLFLKELEKRIVQESDATISVSSPMANYFENIGCKKSASIYLSASVEKLSKKADRMAPCQEDDPISLVYLGTLASTSWHHPSELIALYKHLSSLGRRITLKVITMSNHADIKLQLEESGIRDASIVLTKSPEELAQHLSEMQIGVLSYFKPKNENEKLLSNVVMAVKTAEYLAAGLPILVNRFCGGAAGVVKDNSVGIAYDPGTFEEIDGSSLQSLLHPEVSGRAVELAWDLFDYKSNAQRYKNIYLEVTAEK